MDGWGAVLDYEPYAGEVEEAWLSGSLPGTRRHGAPLREWRSLGHDAQGRRTARLTQEFADGASVMRELTVDDQGAVVAVRLYDTSADGSRAGFRIEGEARLPAPILASRDQMFGTSIARLKMKPAASNPSDALAMPPPDMCRGQGHGCGGRASEAMRPNRTN